MYTVQDLSFKVVVWHGKPIAAFNATLNFENGYGVSVTYSGDEVFTDEDCLNAFSIATVTNGGEIDSKSIVFTRDLNEITKMMEKIQSFPSTKP